MKNRKIGVGIIGSGLFARQCHIEGIQSHPDAEVRALCSRKQEPLQDIARQYQIPSIHQDYNELLKREDIDAVSIVTPDSTHYEIATAAIANGKHVFCEKPLAMNVKEARIMTEKAEESGLINMVAFTFRYTEAMQKLRDLLRSGLIGRPVKATIQANWGEILKPDELTWREDELYSSGGIWADAGSHLFDTLSYTIGDVSSLTCSMGIVKRDDSSMQPSTFDYASCLARIEKLETAGNLSAKSKEAILVEMLISRISRPLGSIHEFQVTGTEGSLGISMTRGDNEYVNYLPASSEEWQSIKLSAKAYDEEPDALKKMMQSFVEAVKSGKIDDRVDATFRDALKAQIALETGLKSASDLTWEKVSQKTPALVS